MSNYLNNLVARNQAAIEVVRPRLPSIFEPAAALSLISPTLHQVAQLESEPLSDDASLPPRLDMKDATEARRERKPLIKPQDQARRHDPPTPAQTIPAWRGIQVIEKAQPVFRPSASAAQGSTDSLPRSTTITNAQENNRGVRAETGAEQRVSRRPFESEPHQANPSLSHVPARRERESTSAASLIEPADARIVVRPRLSVHSQATSGSRNPDSDRDWSRREPITHPATEPRMPTINVTIGRIEIKATPPASAPTPSRKPTPSLMSLDEYMRRRNSGGDSR